jgi:L-iditol 2-dehydrogenase
MRAILATGPNSFALQEVDEPAPGKDDVVIKVRMAGVCASDVHLLRGRNPFSRYPLIPGHEYMGEVLRAPSKSGLRKGDKVTVFPEKGCGKCPACKAGKTVHCPEFKFIGSGISGGCFAERVVVPYKNVFRLPKKMEDPVGAMVEPTAVAVHANKRAGLRKGMKAVVIGGGTIGLLTAQVARAYGASPVILSELIDARRAIAKTLGFRFLCNPSEEELPSFVQKNAGLADVVFDVVATPKSLDDSLSMLRPDGRLVLVGLPASADLAIPYRPIFGKELQVIGVRTYFRQDFPEAIRLLNSGKVNVKPMVSEILPLDRFLEGLENLEREPENYVKILIQPNA